MTNYQDADGRGALEAQPARSMSEQVHDLATTVGATSSSAQFDGGQQFTVTLPGKGSIRVTYEWGDSEDEIVRLMRERMIEAGWFQQVRYEFLLDFGSGRSASIWASDEQAAVRLAGQGEPETITNLTTGETYDWIAPR